MTTPRYTLGLDASTQSLSCCILDLDADTIAYRDSIGYGPHLGDRYGVHHGYYDNGAGWAAVPPLLFPDALELLFVRLRDRFGQVGAIGAVAGSAQQHGVVCLNEHFAATLAALDPAQPMSGQLRDCFARPTATMWRDATPVSEVAEIDAAFGGPVATAAATGSAATLRFAAAQLLRISRREPAAWSEASHVALISSYLASLLAGSLAPTTFTEAAGTNLFGLTRRTYLDALPAPLDSFRPFDRLPRPVAPTTEIGTIAPYLVRRFGFAPDCRVLVFDGDNADAVVGCGVAPGELVLSLGTSDVALSLVPTPTHDPHGYGHVFGPVLGDGYLTLTCVTNGALAREAVCVRHGLDWVAFDELLRTTPPGNAGRLLLPFFASETTPRMAPLVRYLHGLRDDDAAGCVRGVVEAQALNLQHHSAWQGVPTRILATGGTSVNAAILGIVADVFGVPVQGCAGGEAVALGAALRAAGRTDAPTFSPRGAVIEPRNVGAYGELRARFGAALSGATCP